MLKQVLYLPNHELRHTQRHVFSLEECFPGYTSELLYT